METSAYQAAKLWITGHVPLERNTIHYLIGLALLVAAGIVSVRRLRLAPFAWALGVAAVLGGAMEWADLRDDLASLGYRRWAASGADMLRTTVFPVLGVIAVAIAKNRRNQR